MRETPQSDTALGSLPYYEALTAILGSGIDPTKRLLLVALLSRTNTKPNGIYFQSVKTLGEQIGRSQRHTRRLLKDLKARGLIVGRETSGMTTAYRICWSVLMHPGHPCPPSETSKPAKGGRPCPPTPDADVRSRRTPASPLPGHPCPPNSPLNVPKQPSPSTARGWRGIEKQLSDAGVHEWREAARLARDAGCSSEHIGAVIEYFGSRRDAWGSPEGALYHRVKNATPDKRPDDPATWLPMKPAFARRSQSAKDDERREVERERRRLWSESAARSPPELETEHGERLDAMTDAEVRELIQGYSSPGMLLDLVNANGRTSDKARPLLLRLLYVQSLIATHSKEPMP